jgi:LysM repeat protein
MSDGTVERDARQTFPVRSGLFATVPIVLVGSIAAMTGAVASPAEASPTPVSQSGDGATRASSAQRHEAHFGSSPRASAVVASTRAVVTVPASYLVEPGDTVSDIAGRFGLATASVLAINGLSWSSLIFPGQRLTLATGTTAAAPTNDTRTDGGAYTIAAGDTISGIAARFGVSTLSVLAANSLGWSSIIYPGQSIVIPGRVGPAAATKAQESAQPAAAPTEAAASSQPNPTSSPAVAPPTTPTPPPAPAFVAGSTYTIVSGDTISAIAARSGVSTQQLLDANGLDWSSTIYSGHKLVIPRPDGQSSAADVVPLTDEMASNATTIIQVGRNLGVSDYGIVIALAAAAQESGLRNLDWGDLDSVGLFQQRPSAGWGTVDELTTPSYAAELFFGGPSNPNAGTTRGLLDIPDWENMSVTRAAQSVQISAYPDAYARWEPSARAWLNQLG